MATPDRSLQQPSRGPAPHNRDAVWPILLIAGGAVLFAINRGWLGWDALLGFATLWPLALVAVGASILLGGRYLWAITLGTLAVAALLYLVGGKPLGASGPAPSTVTVSRSLEGADKALVELSPGVAALHVTSLTEGDTLASGTIRTGSGQRLVESFRVQGGTAHYALTSEGTGQTFFPANKGGTWDLALTGLVPLELHVKTGVGAVELDLAGMQLARLAVDTGVGAATLSLPARGRFEADVSSGVGAVTIRVPADLAMRIVAARGLGAVQLPDGLRRDGDTYTSPGYATATDRVDLRVTGGVGAINIERSR